MVGMLPPLAPLPPNASPDAVARHRSMEREKRITDWFWIGVLGAAGGAMLLCLGALALRVFLLALGNETGWF